MRISLDWSKSGSAEDDSYVAVGSEVRYLCSPAHLESMEEQLISEELTGLDSNVEEGIGTPSGYTVGVKKLLLIRVDFSDLEGAPFTEAQGISLISKVNQYYRETSYGKTGFQLHGEGSDLTPVFRMPMTAAYYGTGDHANVLRIDARAAATAAGYKLSNYNFDITCMGRVPGFSWGGLGFVGIPGAWIRNNSSAGTAAHELGHNFGLNHANSWDTDGRSTIGQGRSVEYGDTFDTMGTSSGGNNHFNARYKRYLNWLTSDDVSVIRASGTTRLFVHDNAAAKGIRGLSIRKTSTRNYWVELRQKFTGNQWLTDGVGLRWAGNGNERSDLLDTTPGSPDGKNDAALLMGRTFSDPEAGIHITPVAKSTTVPQWVDVVVNLGTFPDNSPPSLSLEVSSSEVSPGAQVTFTAHASDAEGDPLAYGWDFGGGDFGPNSPSVTHSWTDNAEHLVRCVVSDMKGGTTARSAVVRVGSPTTYRISGRVSANGAFLQHVRVFASARVAYTDRDGTYTIVGLPAGAYSVQAALGDHLFVPYGFSNPIRVGPNAENADFVTGESELDDAITLVSSGSIWKFLDNGSNPGAAWINPSFDDSAWDSGPSKLGYGDGDEATQVSSGPSASNRYITTYFRHVFQIVEPRDFTALKLELLRDDGAVVYLNGKEVLRSNMPDGVITRATLASAAVSGSDETAFVDLALATDGLVPGSNVLAVEVHQSAANSSDLGFDLRVFGLIGVQPLVRSRDVWRFLDDGSDAGTAWVQPGYDDDAWKSGAAKLGYGPVAPASVVNFGPDAADKFITTYFRHSFDVDPAAAMGVVKLGLLRDDGAIVYLNGSEVHRSNLPSGPVGFKTRALVDVTGLEESFFEQIELDPNVLVPGPNIVAVEVHQSDPASPDLAFALTLDVATVARHSPGVTILAPEDKATFHSPSSIRIDAKAHAGYARSISKVEFFANGLKLGEAISAPFFIEWLHPPGGTYALSATGIDGQNTSLRSTPVEVVVIRDEAPGLTWKPLADGLRISWPASAVGWKLHSAPQLSASASWTPVGLPEVVAADEISVVIRPAGGDLFYRLMRVGE